MATSVSWSNFWWFIKLTGQISSSGSQQHWCFSWGKETNVSLPWGDLRTAQFIVGCSTGCTDTPALVWGNFHKWIKGKYSVTHGKHSDVQNQTKITHEIVCLEIWNWGYKRKAIQNIHRALITFILSQVLRNNDDYQNLALYLFSSLFIECYFISCRYMMKLKYFLWASSMCHLLKMMVLPILVSLHFPMYIYLLVSFSLNLISWLIILPFTLLFYPHFGFQICGWQILTKFLYNALAILNTVFFKGYFIFFLLGS